MLSPQAAGALTTVLRTDTFTHAPTGGLERAADEVASDYARGEAAWHEDMCTARPKTGRAALKVDFRLYDPVDLIGKTRVAHLHPYEGMCREVHAGFRTAFLYVDCVSPRIEGSQEVPVRVAGTLDLDPPWPPDTVAIREANLTALHAATLALVKRLGCGNNAGLPDRAVLKKSGKVT
ncbi:hypothetical protein ACIPPS_24305 [Streptomyces sp. NPDC090127]|uniref:hypothetical protein n=1 Tax=Streptomyces sp. NPDC090127 TaxID=3365953 RepID=UPI0038197602